MTLTADFTVTTHGKWILAGEYAVLRGHPVLVFPLHNKTLTLQFERRDCPIQLLNTSTEDQQHYLKVLTQGFNLAGVSISHQQGLFYLNNTIPIRAGLGSSGALCAAISAWFAWQQWIDVDKQYEFAKQLEGDLFHGHSSGVDIIAATAEQGLCFQQGQHHRIVQCWQPHWRLSFSGSKSSTGDAISQVNRLWRANPTLAEALDQQMAASVKLAMAALNTPAEQSGLAQLTQAITQARQCFQQWGLITPQLEQHMTALQEQGALACKPTGSGKGGYVLSLWHSRHEDVHPVSLDFHE